jgi:hypothetical protein
MEAHAMNKKPQGEQTITQSKKGGKGTEAHAMNKKPQGEQPATRSKKGGKGMRMWAVEMPRTEMSLTGRYVIDTPIVLDKTLPARAKMLYELIAGYAEGYSITDNAPDGLLDCPISVIDQMLDLLVKKDYIVQMGADIYHIKTGGNYIG